MIKIQNIFCKIGLHKWKNTFHMKISTLSKFVMLKYFKTKNYKFPNITNDFYVDNRKCKNCGIVDNELTYAKQYLITEIKRINNAK